MLNGLGLWSTPISGQTLIWNSSGRMSAVKRILGNNTVHVERARDPVASIEYCKKDGDFFEVGTFGGGAGRRTDLEELKAAIEGGMYSLDEIRKAHSEVYARYPRFVLEYIQQHRPVREIEAHGFYDWQERLNGELNREPDDRTIHFIVDTEGNTGKSWFAKRYMSLHEHVQILKPSGYKDMAYALNEDVRVLFVDAPRSKQGEFIQYNFLEDCKDGQVFSGKYESRCKLLGKVHVVVLMNEMPDMTKLSQDRYLIIEVESS